MSKNKFPTRITVLYEKPDNDDSYLVVSESLDNAEDGQDAAVYERVSIHKVVKSARLSENE